MTAYKRTAYNKTITVSRTTLHEMFKAQKAFISYWKGESTKTQLKTTLASVAVAGLEKVYNKSVYTAVVGVVVNALAGASKYEKSEILDAAKEGKDSLSELQDKFNVKLNWVNCTMRVNYLKFTNLSTGKADFTIITDNIIPIKFGTKDGGSVPM